MTASVSFSICMQLAPIINPFLPFPGSLNWSWYMFSQFEQFFRLLLVWSINLGKHFIYLLVWNRKPPYYKVFIFQIILNEDF